MKTKRNQPRLSEDEHLQWMRMHSHRMKIALRILKVIQVLFILVSLLSVIITILKD